MILEELNLANLRGFEQIALKFDPKVTALAGVNGVGKSAVLHALTALFSRSLPDFTQSQAKAISFVEDDINRDKPSLETSALFTVAGRRCHVNVQRVRGVENRDRPLLLLESVRTEFSRTGDLDAARNATERDLQDLKDRPEQPLVVFFSPRRQLPGKPKTLPKPKPFAPREAYQFALEDRDVTLREFMHWFRSQAALSGRGRDQRTRTLQVLTQVVTTFLPEFSNLRIESEPLRLVVDKAGLPLTLNQLSDGERGMLAILFDITRRLAIANPALKDPVAEGRAIVLIDEIELHLHPLWQRQVLKRLTQTFARCQFVVTTHSPLVLGEVEAKSIRFLYRENGKVACWVPEHALGLDVNRVLEDIMGVEAREPGTVAKLHKLAQAIDRDEFDEAKRVIDELRGLIGDDPDLVRAQSLMAFLEGNQ